MAAWRTLLVQRELSGPGQPQGKQYLVGTWYMPLGAASSPSDSCPGASRAGKHVTIHKFLSHISLFTLKRLLF